MGKFINIVISGEIGVGKSTIGRGLAKKLGWRYESAGDYFRPYQEEHKIDVSDWKDVPDEVKVDFDMRFRERIRTTPNVLFVGHYQGWNAKDCPGTYKILITAKKDIVSKRIKLRGDEAKFKDEEKRELQLKEVFRKLYGDDDYLNPNFFNLVIDNSSISADEAIESVYNSFQKANL